MCPRPRASGKVSIGVDLENFITPKRDGEESEKRNKVANFFIGDEEENFSTDTPYPESESELSDGNLEMRLNAVNFILTNACLYKEAYECYLETTPIIEQEHQQSTTEQPLVFERTELSKR